MVDLPDPDNPVKKIASPRSARGGRARRSSRATLGGASQPGTSAPESSSAPSSEAVSSPCSAPASISASGRHTSERGSYAHSPALMTGIGTPGSVSVPFLVPAGAPVTSAESASRWVAP